MPADNSSGQGSWSSPVERMRQEFERFLEGAMNQGERAMDFVGLKDLTRPAILPADIIESPEQLQVFVDIPGVDPQLVEITLVGNMLTLKMERVGIKAVGAQVSHRNERACGSLTRSFPLPSPVDPTKVSAESRHGVLVITLPKEEKAKPRHIQVQVQTTPHA